MLDLTQTIVGTLTVQTGPHIGNSSGLHTTELAEIMCLIDN